MSTIYDRIRARRLELGLTAEDLAQQLGYKDKSSISKIENGKADIPQAKVELPPRKPPTTPAAPKTPRLSRTPPTRKPSAPTIRWKTTCGGYTTM